MGDYKVIQALKSFETSNQENAIAAYTAKISDIKMRLDAIYEQADEHFGIEPESINWGDVGSAWHVLDLLNQVCEFLNIGKD